MAIRKPKVVFALLADGHNKNPNGKIDAIGIFDKFLVWATPAFRECSVVFRIADVPAGPSTFHLKIVAPDGAAILIGNVALDVPTSLPSLVAGERMPFQFGATGRYKLEVKLEGVDRAIYTHPFQVDAQQWPELPSGDQLERILADPQSVKAMRAILECTGCKKRFTFQIDLKPGAQRAKDVRPFPKNGNFKCPKCTTEHNLRDIEGQLRWHLSQQHRPEDS